MKTKAFAAATVLALSASQAMAVQQGDWLLRFGIGHVSPNDSSSMFSGLSTFGTGVGSDTQPTINVTYMFTDNLGLDVLGALPFEHDVYATGAVTGKVGATKHLPPTIGVQYHFTPKSTIRPYAGVGVNYTHFWDEKAYTPPHQPQAGRLLWRGRPGRCGRRYQQGLVPECGCPLYQDQYGGHHQHRYRHGRH